MNLEYCYLHYHHYLHVRVLTTMSLLLQENHQRPDFLGILSFIRRSMEL